MSKVSNEKLKNLLMVEDIELANYIQTDDNPPVFYKPIQVIRLSQRLKQFSIIALVISIIINIPQLGQMQNIIFSFFNNLSGYQNISWLITSLIGFVAIIVQSFIVYFLLRAISWILLILMDMEFSSRKQVTSNTT